jgi:hypothetical protein
MSTVRRSLSVSMRTYSFVASRPGVSSMMCRRILPPCGFDIFTMPKVSHGGTREIGIISGSFVELERRSLNDVLLIAVIAGGMARSLSSHWDATARPFLISLHSAHVPRIPHLAQAPGTAATRRARPHRAGRPHDRAYWSPIAAHCPHALTQNSLTQPGTRASPRLRAACSSACEQVKELR